mgnify:CR=1 FL=1
MGRLRPILDTLLAAQSDANTEFSDLLYLLQHLGFERRVKGSHHMNGKYEIIIYWSAEDAWFIAEAPELPGCMADGATYQEALAALGTVIDDWIETAESLGRLVPAPKGRLLFA